jgi:AraC-like DNA-binding protein
VIYIERKPSPALAGCVEMIWYASSPNVSHERELVLPNGKTQFIVSLVADHLTECGRDEDRLVDPALLVGAGTSAEIIATRDIKELVGVVFRPGGLGPWLRERADQFFGRSISLDSVWHEQALRERIRNEGSPPEDSLRIVDDVLCKRSSGRSPRRHVMAAVRLLRVCSVRDAAKKLGISERRLHLVFCEDVGMSPKQWSRVQRFQRALTMLHSGADMRWAELAAACGYSDQSHFSRDFRDFSSIDPTTYCSFRGPWLNHVPVQGFATGRW